MDNDSKYTQLVWAKFAGYPWWPGYLTGVSSGSKVEVSFFGIFDRSMVSEKLVRPFEEAPALGRREARGRGLTIAVEMARRVQSGDSTIEEEFLRVSQGKFEPTSSPLQASEKLADSTTAPSVCGSVLEAPQVAGDRIAAGVARVREVFSAEAPCPDCQLASIPEIVSEKSIQSEKSEKPPSKIDPSIQHRVHKKLVKIIRQHSSVRLAKADCEATASAVHSLVKARSRSLLAYKRAIIRLVHRRKERLVELAAKLAVPQTKEVWSEMTRKLVEEDD